jgi:phosphate transport system substrate-binding protein
LRFPRAALLPSLIASLLTIAACSKSTPTATEVAAGDKDISGAGSTFFYPIASKWADTYKKETGIGLNYQSIGSGGGIKQIKAKTVTFGASDKPLSLDELNEAGLIQFPAIIGGVIPVVNLEGVTPGQLVLDGKTLAAIFVGDIKKWDDAAIKALNPDVKLPSADIAIVHRSDGSGTTFLFTDYLSKVDENWKGKVGANSAVEWPTGIGAKGNEGVAGVVKQTAASIGYVEYAYAKQNAMSHVRLTNKAGKVVEPGIASFQAAAANADWAAAPGMNVVLPDPDRPAGRAELADHRCHLHRDARQAGQAGQRDPVAQVLRLGLPQRRQDGHRAGVRAVARRRRGTGAQGVGQDHRRHPPGRVPLSSFHEPALDHRPVQPDIA